MKNCTDNLIIVLLQDYLLGKSIVVIIKSIPGCLSKGYVSIRINGILYLAHRLAWFWVYGYMPENDLDHIKRVRNDNRIRRLREISKSCNSQNIGTLKNNTSGVKGVNLDKNTNKWGAKIESNNKKYHLGAYKDFDEAVCARLAGEQCLNWGVCDSASPAYLYVKEHIQRR